MRNFQQDLRVEIGIEPVFNCRFHKRNYSDEGMVIPTQVQFFDPSVLWVSDLLMTASDR